MKRTDTHCNDFLFCCEANVIRRYLSDPKDRFKDLQLIISIKHRRFKNAQKNANAQQISRIFFSKFDEYPWIHFYSYLGPLEIYHVHVIHLDLNNLRHFQVVRKQLEKVVWRALNFVLRRWLAMMYNNPCYTCMNTMLRRNWKNNSKYLWKLTGLWNIYENPRCITVFEFFSTHKTWLI